MIFRILVFCAIICQASGNGGRLMDPPGRSSAWRVGFQTPHNNIDDNLSCGGFLTQLSNNQKCGVCGDPWNGKRENEAGGKYATGTIVKRYLMGQTINLQVEVTNNRYGWMEYRICPNNDVTKPVTHDCLNAHVLQRADGNDTKTFIDVKRYGIWKMAYKLPDGMKCSQCVLQWKYNTGDTWGVDKTTGKACIGCGFQEQFYGCADISIQESGPLSKVITTLKPLRAQTTKSPAPTAQLYTGVKVPCRGIHNWTNDPEMDTWCTENCAIGNCPVYGCDCSNGSNIITRTPLLSSTTTTTTSTTTTTPTTKTTTQPSTSTTQPLTSSTTMMTSSTTMMSSATKPKTTKPIISTGKQQVCKATNLWKGNAYLDRLCAELCSKGNCPSMSCQCTVVAKVVTQSSTTTTAVPVTSPKPGTKVCLALSIWKGLKVFDNWCTEECNKGNCPLDTCQCREIPAIPTTTSSPATTRDMTPLGRCTSNGIVGGAYWNEWCQKKCDMGECDIGYCYCNI